MPPRWRTRTLLIASLALLPACTGSVPGWTQPVASGNDLSRDYNPFAPDAIRIHPLSHATKSEHGAAIICHLEVTDRWGDAVKALGTLQVQLYRPRAGLDAGTAEQILRWDIPLDDERYNAAVYDPATRTYRIELVGLPDWIDPASGGATRLELRAVFQTLGPRGEERVFRDGRVLVI